MIGPPHLLLQRLEHARRRLGVLRGDVAVHHRLGERRMLAQQVGQAVARRRVELDRPVAPHRPDALQHQFGGPQVAAPRALDGVEHQLVRHLDAQAVELAGRCAERIARPARATGMALGEAAVGLTKIGIGHGNLLNMLRRSG